MGGPKPARFQAVEVIDVHPQMVAVFVHVPFLECASALNLEVDGQPGAFLQILGDGGADQRPQRQRPAANVIGPAEQRPERVVVEHDPQGQRLGSWDVPALSRLGRRVHRTRLRRSAQRGQGWIVRDRRGGTRLVWVQPSIEYRSWWPCQTLSAERTADLAVSQAS